MTVQLEFLLEVCFLLEYLNTVLCINAWAQTFQSKHIQVPMRMEKQGSTVQIFCLVNVSRAFMPAVITSTA